MNGLLYDLLLLLAAAVVMVPLAERLGLGSVLGYLIAGVLLGPFGFRAIVDTEGLTQVSELGVVFLLFIIGLELEMKRLWALRISIFGMGSLQLAVVALVITGLGVLLGASWKMSLVIGLGFALSSTALVMQILNERKIFTSPAGSSAFSVLLFQDMAVVPLLALLPVMAGEAEGAGHASAWKIIAAIVAVVVLGRWLLRPAFRLVAASGQREIFTALSLLLVMGLSVLMHNLGVSMGLGAFLGGLLLASSEYRTAIETDIEPFKGLLLGLFFMSVGMGIDLPIIVAKPFIVLGLFAGIFIVKIPVQLLLARIFRLPRAEGALFSVLIAQVGEFAFVFFAAAVGAGLMGAEPSALAGAAVALSMAATPLLLLAHDRWVAPRFARSTAKPENNFEEDNAQVLIAGFGRVGQMVGRLLYSQRISAVVLDHDADQIELLRRFRFSRLLRRRPAP